VQRRAAKKRSSVTAIFYTGKNNPSQQPCWHGIRVSAKTLTPIERDETAWNQSKRQSAHSGRQENNVTGDYQVRVKRDTADYDDYGVPRVTRTPACVEIATSQRKLVFADRAALQEFIDTYIRAREEAFGAASDPALSEADKAAWGRFFGRITAL
jgi:hypothetical protein